MATKHVIVQVLLTKLNGRVAGKDAGRDTLHFHWHRRFQEVQ